MAYCTHCGALRPTGAAYCVACGEPTGVPERSATAMYAGFWQRVGASLVDFAVVAGPIVAAGLLLWREFGYTFWFHTHRDAAGHLTIHGPSPRIDALFQLAGTIPSWLYSARLQSGARQATVGQRVAGIKVTGLDGERITFARATGRYFASALSAYTLLIGYLMMLWTERRQCLHDKIADTLVVRAEE